MSWLYLTRNSWASSYKFAHRKDFIINVYGISDSYCSIFSEYSFHSIDFVANAWAVDLLLILSSSGTIQLEAKLFSVSHFEYDWNNNKKQPHRDKLKIAFCTFSIAKLTVISAPSPPLLSTSNLREIVLLRLFNVLFDFTETGAFYKQKRKLNSKEFHKFDSPTFNYPTHVHERIYFNGEILVSLRHSKLFHAMIHF